MLISVFPWIIWVPGRLCCFPFSGDSIPASVVKDMSHDWLSRELFQVTGGFSSFPEASTTSEGIKSYLFFRLKCLEDRLDESLGLVWSMLATADFTAVSRIGDVLAEMKNDYALIDSSTGKTTMRCFMPYEDTRQPCRRKNYGRV